LGPVYVAILFSPVGVSEPSSKTTWF